MPRDQMPLPVEPTRFPLPVERLSPTSINCFLTCPEQFRLRHVLKQPRRPVGVLIWGSADHYAHEVNLTQKIETHADLPTDDVLDAFRTSVDERLDEAGGPGEVDWGSHKPTDIIDTGVERVREYHEHVSPLVQPVYVEKWIRLDVPGVGVPIVGRIDIETANRVIDRKMEARIPKQLESKHLMQAAIYAKATGKKAGFHIQSRKGGVSHGPNLEVMPDLTTVDQMLQRVSFQISALYGAYGPDDPWPGAISHPWACGYCEQRARCPWPAGFRGEAAFTP